MSKHRKTPYIIAYDIGDRKRLVKVHRRIKQQAIPLQYSVFYAKLNQQELQRLIDQLNDLIVDSEDDIRIYPLPQKPKWSSFGKSLFPENYYGDESLPQNHLYGDNDD